MKLPNWLSRLLARITPATPASPARFYTVSRQAGEYVSPDSALTVGAVFACVRVISETLAMLPWHVYARNANGTKTRLDNSVARLLDSRPNGEMNALEFRETLIAWALTWGNGYAEIERDIANRPTALWPISPDRVDVRRDGNGALYYTVSTTGGLVDVDPANIFHVHGLGWDGLTGYSVINYARRSIGLGMATEHFGANFFENGTIMSGVLTHPASLSQEAQNNIRASWAETHAGPKNAWKPAILEEGMKWESIGVPPEDAQFLQTRQFQIEEIARWFRVPPHLIGDLSRAHYNNIEHSGIEFVNFTLLPWAVRLEQEADAKLFSYRTPYYTKISLQGLLRGDNASRATFYKEMLNMGVFSVNEIRKFEDLDPIGDEGDEHYMQLNMTTLERIAEGEENEEAETETEAETLLTSSPETEDEDDAATETT